MPRILIGAGFEEYKAFVTTAGMAGVGLLGVAVAAVLVERVGRKWILAITGPLSALTLVIVSLVVDIPDAAVFWLLAFGFVIQVAIPVLYTYVSELYPTELRGSGFGWASTFSRVGAGLGPLVFASYFWPEFCPPTQLARIRCRFRASKRHLLRVSWAKRRAQACFPAASSASVRTRSRRSTTLMRSCRVSSVSSGAMSTASWAMIGPVSTPASAQCTVQPVTFTP
jgi:hypothetical protein